MKKVWLASLFLFFGYIKGMERNPVPIDPMDGGEISQYYQLYMLYASDPEFLRHYHLFINHNNTPAEAVWRAIEKTHIINSNQF